MLHLLAHQGGWDEILMVLAPLLIFAGLLALARRRVDAMEHDERRGPARDDMAPGGIPRRQHDGDR